MLLTDKELRDIEIMNERTWLPDATISRLVAHIRGQAQEHAEQLRGVAQWLRDKGGGQKTVPDALPYWQKADEICALADKLVGRKGGDLHVPVEGPAVPSEG